MGALDIVFLVLGCLIGIFLLVLFFFLSLALKFYSRLKKRCNAITLLLIQKHDLLLTFDKIFENHKVKIDENSKPVLSDITHLKFQNLNKKERDAVLLNFSKAYSFYSNLGEENKSVKKDTEFIEISKTIQDADEAYRQSVARYNNDLGGYNYWVGFPVYRLIFKLFGLKKKDIIN
jgi:hypothetical protein